MRKNTLNNYQTITAGDASGTITSAITNIQLLDNIGIQVNVKSGTPTGTLSVQVSADHKTSLPTGDVVTAGQFIQVTSGVITAGVPTSTYFDLTQLSAPFIRLVYTPSAGSGSLDAFIVGKSV